MSKPAGLASRRNGKAGAATEPSPEAPADQYFAVEPLAPSGRRFGVDIDGATVRVVEVEGPTVLSFATYQGNTAADAFGQFLDTKPQGQIVVVWADDEVHLRRVPLPNLPAVALRAGLLDAVEETLPMTPGTAAVAARVTASRAGEGYMASVAAMDKRALAQLWSMVAVPGARVVPGPLLFAEDGLYLGLRDGGAQLLLAAGGAAIATRNLSAGGLVTVRDELADGDQSPEERLTTIARGGTRLDPGAASAVDRYAQAISDEVRRTADFWSRQGLAVPAEIYVHGQGIALPNLAGKLLDAAFLAKAAPVPSVAMEAIARADVPRAYMAILATQFNPAVQVLADLPDPLAAERVRRRNEKARASGRLAVAGASVVGLTALLAGPVFLARRELSSARADKARAAADLAVLHPAVQLAESVNRGKRAYRTAITDEVDWRAYLEKTFAASPQATPAAFVSLTAERRVRTVQIDIKAKLPGTDFTPVSAWLRSLKDTGMPIPWASSVRVTDDAQSGQSYVSVSLSGVTTLSAEYYAARDLATRLGIGPSGTVLKPAKAPATTAATP